MDSTTAAAAISPEPMSLTESLLEKPSRFQSLQPSEISALSHLCAALALVKSTDSADSPTLGTQADLYPLIKGFKRFQGSKGHLKEAEDEAEREEKEEEAEEATKEEKGDIEGMEEGEGDGDSFDLTDGADEMSVEDKKLVEKIQKKFLKLARNPNTRKPNFKRIFEELDEDGSGKLQEEELGKAMEAMGIDLTADEVSRLISKIDTDDDGDVDYMEFIRFVKVGGEEGDGRTATDKIEDALTHASRAIFLHSDHNFFNMRAECYIRLHDLKSCVSNLRYVLKMLPGDQETRKRLSKVLDLQGINWLRLKNYAAAESCFSETCKLDPVKATFWIHKSIALLYSQDFSEALRAVEQAMSVEQATADVFCLRGKIHWALNLTDAGNRDFRSAQELEPEHPEVVSFISAMIKRSGTYYKEAMAKLQLINVSGKNEEETREALRLLTQALNLVPDDMRLLTLRSKAYRSIGEFELSLKDIDDATFHYCQSMMGNEVPKFVPNRRMWLETQSMKSNYREPAILTQQRSLTLNEMAMVQVKLGKYIKAVSLLNRVIEEEYKLHGKDMTKVDAKYFINRGDCYRATGKIEQAMSDFHRAYDSDPNNWQTKTRLSMIHYMAGLQLFNEGLYNPAEIEFTVAIKYNSKVSGYWAARGKACFYQYNYDGAFEDYKGALRLDPRNADVLQRMQQFDPDGKILDEINAEKKGDANAVNDPYNKKKGRNLGSGLGAADMLMSRTVPTPPPSKISKFPVITPVTSVNPFMAKAEVVKGYVDSKRIFMKKTLSVNQRRSMHPIKKGSHWSVMEPKPVVYKSLTDRKAKLEKEKSQNKKKAKVFNSRKRIMLGASSKAFFT